MSCEKRLLVTCDRCGKTESFKYLGTNMFRDASWSMADQFEPMKSKNWMHYSDFGDLCPECDELLKKMKGDFFDVGDVE